MALPRYRLALLLVRLGAGHPQRSGIELGRAGPAPPVAAGGARLGGGAGVGRLDRLEPQRRDRAGFGRAAVSADPGHGGGGVRGPALVAVPVAARALARQLSGAVRARLAERSDPCPGGAVHRADLAAAVVVGGAVPAAGGDVLPRPVPAGRVHCAGHRQPGRVRRADRAHPAPRDPDHPPGAVRDLPRAAAAAVVHRGAVRAEPAAHRARAAVEDPLGRQPAAGAVAVAGDVHQCGLPAGGRQRPLPPAAATPC
ncbi:Uncharacterised protein [Stenotrophomonas maltophilia]|nr:Uncharacterised protein [Stenotrophomonas maltophilia]